MATDDPYMVLGVDETAGDEDVRQRYLDLVRTYPPDREPERFQEIRAAYDALKTERDRLAARMFHVSAAPMQRLRLACLQPGPEGRASSATVTALLLAGVEAAMDG